MRTRYNGARMAELKAAYDRVAGTAGGLEDLAKYLLYRDTSLASDLAAREEAELIRLAAEDAAREVGKKAGEYRVAATVSTALAGSLTAAAITALASLFGAGAAAGLFIAAGVAAAAAWGFSVMARDLNDIRKQIEDVARGNGAVRDEAAAAGAAALADWKVKRAYLEEKRAVLDIYYGKRPEGEAELSYEKFAASLGLILENAKGQVRKAEMNTYFSKELFLAAHANEAESTMEAVKAVARYHEENEAAAREKLEAERARALMKKQADDTGAFQAKLAELMEIPEAGKAVLRELALRAGDRTLSVAERQKAEADYDALMAALNGEAAEEAARKELAVLAEDALGDATWFMREHDRRLLELEGKTLNSRTDYTRVAEDYTLLELARMRELALAAADNAAAGQRELKQAEWALAQKAFYAQYAEWTAQINAVLARSAAEWQKAEEKLNAGYNEWRRNFENTYIERTGEWRENYESFLEDKDAWMREQYLYAANYANYGVMAQSGMNAGAAIADALQNMENAARPLEEQGFDTGIYIEKLVGDSNLAGLMAYTGDLNAKASGAAGVVRRGTALSAGSASSYAKAEAVLEEIGGERRVAAAKLAAEEARKQLAAARKSYAERLMAENKGMRDWEIGMTRQSGYAASGDNVSRRVVTDSLLFENKHETQTVHMYEDFVTAEANITTGLTDAELEGLDDYGVMMMLAKAQKELADWGEKIFGRVDDEGGQVQIRIARNGAEAARDAEKGEQDSGNKDIAFRRDGELGEHIGYAPVFKEGEDLDLKESRADNVAYYGDGEIGKIMLDFQWNEIMRGKGYGEMALPMWDKRMWDDDGSWLQAPTLRTVTEIAVTVASGIVSAGAGSLLMASVQTAGIGLAKDVFFSSIDFAGGYIDSSQFGTQLGKAMLSAGVNVAVGAAFNGVGAYKEVTKVAENGVKTVTKEAASGGLKAVVGEKAMENIAVKAGMAMAQTYTSGVTSSLVGAIGSDDYWGTVGEAAWSAGTLANVMSAGAGSLAGSMIGKLDAEFTEKYGKTLKFGTAMAGETARFATYAVYNMFDGATHENFLADTFDQMEFTVNLLNLGDIVDLFDGAGTSRTANSLSGTGLFELHLNSQGVKAGKLGTGGVDVSLGTLGNLAVAGWNGAIAGAIALRDNPKAQDAVAKIAYPAFTEEQKQKWDSIRAANPESQQDIVNKNIFLAAEDDNAPESGSDASQNPFSVKFSPAGITAEYNNPKVSFTTAVEHFGLGDFAKKVIENEYPDKLVLDTFKESVGMSTSLGVVMPLGPNALFSANFFNALIGPEKRVLKLSYSKKF